MLGVKGNITNDNWRQFYQRIIDKRGYVSNKDAKECNIPFGVWFEIINRPGFSPETLYKIARDNINKIK